MSLLLKSVGAITLFVEDLQSTRRFYEDVFGLQAIYEDESSTAFRVDNTIVNLLEASAARTLVEPAAVAGRDAGSRFQLTIWVDDAYAACAELEARGVTLLNGPTDREWGMRTAAFADPAGNVWEVAQELARAEQ